MLRLQNGLASLGYQVGTPDGIFGGKTEDAVQDFQADADLTPDGIFGKGSLAAYNTKVAQEFRFVVDIAPDPAPSAQQNRWVTVPCHVAANGYSTTTLRDDAAQAFRAMYDEVGRLGGKLTSAGGKRPLSAGGGKAQSKTSMHYLGRAHDMALGAGMQDPTRDPCVVVRRSSDAADRKWVIWMRTDNPAVPVVTLQGVKCSTVNGKTVLTTIPVTGRFFSFTELAARYSWTPISARRFFFQGGSYSGAEWWHFQWEQGLVKGQTTFGSELLRLYSLTEAHKLAWWDEVKDAVFGDEFA